MIIAVKCMVMAVAMRRQKHLYVLPAAVKMTVVTWNASVLTGAVLITPL